MAPPPPKKTVTREDVPGAPEWLDRLLAPLNAFMTPAAAALSRGLTFRENFSGEVKTVEVTPPEDWVPWGYAANWSQFPSADFPVPAWQKGLDGWVRCRGVVRYTGGGSPAAESQVVSGAPPPAARSRFAVDMSSAPGLLTGNIDGSLVFGYGSPTIVSLAGIQYEAADRAPPRWAAPVDVRLGTEQTPFPGRPGSVFLLDARQKGVVGTPVVIAGLDWGAINMEKQRNAPGVRLHRVWGLNPGVTYTLRLLVLPE